MSFWVDFEELDRCLRGVLDLGLTKLLTKNYYILAYHTDSLFIFLPRGFD